MGRTKLFVLVALSGSLLGCNLLKMSPEKACKKAETIFASGDESAATTARNKAKCLSDLTKMKREEPKQYDCTTKCLKSNAVAEDAKACMKGCAVIYGGTIATSTDESDDTSLKTYPVDSLSSSDISYKVTSTYGVLDSDVTNEKSNAVGWSGTVALGRKGSSGEVHIYKVLLVDVNGRSDGFKVIAGLKSGRGATESRVGNKKALLVQCMYQRSSYEKGVPKECSAYDSKISSFTNTLASAY